MLCNSCKEDIPYTYNWSYGDNSMERRIIDKGIFVRAGAALYFYRAAQDQSYAEVIHRFKYGGDIALGRMFSAELGEKLASCGRFKEVSAVVPVPLHPLKRFKRGFNQAEVIAIEVAEALRISCESKLLFRKRYTSAQARRRRGERERNVSGAFSICHSEVARLQAEGKMHLLVIDDVFTTGATLSAAIRPLIDAGFAVSIATLACVEE